MEEDKSPEEIFDKYVDQEKLWSTEGARGVSNLCKLVRAIGHKDFLCNGSLTNGGYLGDLMVFFEENPGAIEAVMEWIRENMDCAGDWAEKLESQLLAEEEEEDA